MNIQAMEEDTGFDLSGDFNDALSVIAATDPDYANKTINNNNNNSSNNNANIQSLLPMSSECLVEEQQQRRRQLLSQQSQTIAHHQTMQTTYQPQFPNQNHRLISQQQRQRILAYQRQCQQQQQQQQLSQVQSNQAAQIHQAVPQIQNQATQIRQAVPQIPNQVTQVRQAVPQMQNQAAQIRDAVPKIQNQAVQIGQSVPQMQNQAAQIRQAMPQLGQSVPQMQNQAAQIRQAVPQIQAAQMHQTGPQIHNQAVEASQIQSQPTQIRQVVPQIQNQAVQAPQVVPQIQSQASQIHQASRFHQSQAHQQNQYHQPQLQNQQAQRPMTPEQQRIIAACQQLYPSTQQVQNQQSQQQQQQTSLNFVSQPASPVCSRQNAYSMMPRQDEFENVVKQELAVVQSTVQEPRMQIQRTKPYIEIVEQPACRGSRFRYGCEVRTNGSIPGINSKPDNKTYPTIRVVGFNGDAIVVVSCVTKDPPYRPHPHNLVGKVLCKNGICKATISKDNTTVSFDRLGIQCIKKKDVLNSLNQREKIKVDPFNQGFDGKNNPGCFDLSCVRLAFQVFLEGPAKGQFKIPLQPVVSDPIYDKKSSPDLTIYKLSHCSSPANGGQDMILLCDKVTKDDIQVRFYEEHDDDLVWEAFGTLYRTGAIHKHVAILFQSPKYRMTDFNEVINVHVELVRPSDGMCSNPVVFYITPVNNPVEMRKKRKRIHESLMDNHLMENLEASAYADQWNIMNQSNFNVIEAR